MTAMTMKVRSNRSRRWLLLACLFGLWSWSAALAQPVAITIRYPANSGVINIKEAPYNAKGDGVTDDYAAIQQALNDVKDDKRRTIFFPVGTYMISNTLDWGDPWRFTRIVGENHDNSIIKLFNNLPAYQDRSNPKAMVFTGPDPAQRFFNSIRNLTFHTGTGNPGTAAIRFHASNQGSIEDVDIISGDGQGVRGLDLQFSGEIGPLYVKNVYVKGFDYGIDVNALNSLTMKNVYVENQNIAGVRNLNNQLFVDGLTSLQAQPIPGFVSLYGSAVLINATLTGPGSTTVTAIQANSLYARSVKTTGYARALQNLNGTNPNGANLGEYYNAGTLQQFSGSQTGSLKLSQQQTPNVPWGDPDSPSSWANVMDFGARGDGSLNDAPAVQRAVDSGAETVYFPNGKRFLLTSEIHVKPTTRRITGAGLATVSGGGRFIVTTGSNPVIFQDMMSEANGSSASVFHAGARTVILKNLSIPYASAACGAGDVFMEDVALGVTQFNNQRVWAWQLNPEGNGLTTTQGLIGNAGGDLWVFGLKTEGNGPILLTENKGRSEVLGYTNYSNNPAAGTPIFIANEAALSVAMMYEVNFSGQTFSNLVRETRNGVTNTLAASASPRFIGLYQGSPAPLPAAAPACPAPLTTFLTAPRPKDVLLEGNQILQAEAFQTKRSIARVEFYVNGRFVGQDASAPYSVTASLVPGDSLLTTKAISNSSSAGPSETATSAPVRITTLSTPNCAMSKGVYFEKWNDPADYQLNNVPLNRAPNSTEVLPTTRYINYDGNTPGSAISAMMKGFLCPPQSGTYTFYSAANEKGRFWLSTSMQPTNKRLISEMGYNGYPYEEWNWQQYPERQISQPIYLEQGKLYYFESSLIMWDGEPIYLGLGWQLPDGTLQRPIPGSSVINYQNLLPNASEFYEAELATLTSLTTATNGAGYTGASFARFTSNNVGTLDWSNVTVAQAGTYPLTFRYSLTGSSNRTASLRVNGQTISTLAFPLTGNVGNWATVPVNVGLQAGVNSIRLVAAGSNGINIDHLRVDAPLPAAGGRRNAELELTDEALVAFPNPASEQINVRYVAREASRVTLTLTDLTGREVLRESRQAEVGTNTWPLATATVPNGLYFVRVADATRQPVTRVMVAK